MTMMLLPGCTVRPLANYLKALGVARLISEQWDSGLKCCWQDTVFALSTEAARKDIEDFFCHRYEPTPLISPWNGGSGFYSGDNCTALEAIMNSRDPRFDRYRAVIQTVRTIVPPGPQTVGDLLTQLEGALHSTKGKKQREFQQHRDTVNRAIQKITAFDGTVSEADILRKSIEELVEYETQSPERELYNAAKKARTACNELIRRKDKTGLLAQCRNVLPDCILDWLDAVYMLGATSRTKLFLNPLLGSGANDGNFEFTNNFMQRVTDLLLNREANMQRRLLGSALWGDPIAGLDKAGMGMYDPGRAGGLNQGVGFESDKAAVNPWDYVLAMEGMLLFACAIARRSSADADWFTAPFSVKLSPVGYTSAEDNESGNEIWLPLWHKPASLAEIKYLFSEGRCVLDRRPPRTGLDYARAVALLGVDRGISAFERYVFLTRRGKSQVAAPAGRVAVGYRPAVRLLADLDDMLRNLDIFLRGFSNIPATYQSVRRQLETAMFACTIKDPPHPYVTLLRILGRLTRLLSSRDRNAKPQLARPLWGLSPEWLATCDDGSIEMRLAAALASIGSTGKVGSLYAYMVGVDDRAPWRWGQDTKKRCWYGNSLARRLANLLVRRQMDADRTQTAEYPLHARLAAHPGDIMAFLYGETDDIKLEELLWAFSLLDWRNAGRNLRSEFSTAVTGETISRTWCLLKLLHTPYPRTADIPMRYEQRIGPLLLAGRVGEACHIAQRRLMVAQRHPFIVEYREELDPVRLAASLLFPISPRERRDIERLVLYPQNKREGKGV